MQTRSVVPPSYVEARGCVRLDLPLANKQRPSDICRDNMREGAEHCCPKRHLNTDGELMQLGARWKIRKSLEARPP